MRSNLNSLYFDTNSKQEKQMKHDETIGTRTLLGAPGIATSNKKPLAYFSTSFLLLLVRHLLLLAMHLLLLGNNK